MCGPKSKLERREFREKQGANGWRGFLRKRGKSFFLGCSAQPAPPPAQGPRLGITV